MTNIQIPTQKKERLNVIKIAISILFLFIIAIVLFFLTSTNNKLNEEQALDVLVSRISEDKLYLNRISLSCLSFSTEKRNIEYFDFVIYEKHDEKCQGDKSTSPVVDRFRVNRMTKNIQWYDPVQNKLLPYTAIHNIGIQNTL